MAKMLDERLPLIAFARDPLGFLLRLRQGGRIVPIRLGKQHGWFLNDSDAIHDVLVTHQASFHKGRGLQLAREGIVGEGLLTAEGETHRRHRRIIQPAFHIRQIANYATIMAETAAHYAPRFPDGEVIDIHSQMMQLTLDIICESMFGGQIDADKHAIEEGLTISLRALVQRTRSPLPAFLIKHMAAQKRAKKAGELLADILNKLIEKRRLKTDTERGDLLAMLLSARDEEDGSALTDKEIRDEVATIFIAGHETTANALSWTWLLLSQHADVVTALQAEVDSVLGGRVPTYEDYANLTYTRQVVAESMRLYPPAWILIREVVQPVRIGDIQMEKGNICLLSPYVMHRDEEYFPNANVFLPNRWNEDLQKRIPRYAYFPFGGGPRVCIGNHFALLEATLVLAELAQRVELELVGAAEEIKPEPLITLRVRGALNMRVKKRQTKSQ